MNPIEIKALKLVKMPLRGVVTDRDIYALRARNAERIEAQKVSSLAGSSSASAQQALAAGPAQQGSTQADFFYP
jgi:hypothetical protein